MLKKKFFIHLFFSTESQYDILEATPANSEPPRPKIKGSQPASFTAKSAFFLTRFLSAVLKNMRFISFEKYRKRLLISCAQTLSSLILAILTRRQQNLELALQNN
jgi:hypothetical protein